MTQRSHDRHALALRDVAMHIVRAQGPSYRDAYIVLEYRAEVDNRPHGIDIWRRGDFDMKVLSVIWHGDAAMVVSYRSGTWERALHRAAAGVRREAS
jgi:hypothetical protein